MTLTQSDSRVQVDAMIANQVLQFASNFRTGTCETVRTLHTLSIALSQWTLNQLRYEPGCIRLSPVENAPKDLGSGLGCLLIDSDRIVGPWHVYENQENHCRFLLGCTFTHSGRM